MRKEFLCLIIALLSCSALRSESVEDMPLGPFFTGPLLTPSAQTIPVGHFDIEPYFFINRVTGSYDADWKGHSGNTSTSFINQYAMFAGLTSFMDLQVSPFYVYTNKHGHSATRFGDLPVALGFQLYREKPGEAVPSFRFVIAEEFPTGQFERLNPNKMGADSSGSGAYVTSFGLIIGKLFHFGGSNFFRMRFNTNYSIPTHVHVSGFNTYGGGYGAHGTVTPPKELNVLLGLEYTPALHWAFALDVFFISTEKTKFRGFPGTVTPGQSETPINDQQLPPFTLASVGNHSSEQVSLAPAIEYNFTQNVGIIGGVWFSVAGRNSSQFVNGVLAVNVYF